MKKEPDITNAYLIAQDYYGNRVALIGIVGGFVVSFLMIFSPECKHNSFTLSASAWITLTYLVWSYLYLKGQTLSMKKAFWTSRIVGIGMSLSWPYFLICFAVTQRHSPHLIDLSILYNQCLISAFPNVFRYDRMVTRFSIATLTVSLIAIGYQKFNGSYWVIFLIGSMIYSYFTAFATEARIRSEIKLKTHQKRLEKIFDAFPGGVSLLKDLQYQTVNKYIHETLPLAGDLIAKPLDYHNPESDWVMKIKKFAKGEEEQILFESVITTKQGHRTFLTAATKIGDDEIVLISLDTQDLTDARQELEAQRARNIANAKLASLAEMGAGIAHEINNPLAVLKGRLTLLDRAIQADPLEREKLQHHASKLMPMVERIEKIVRSMRNLSQTDDLDMDLQETTMKRIIEEAFVFIEARLKNYGAELRVVGNALDIPIMAVESELTQVLVNALANSHDAIQAVSEKWIELEALEESHQVTLLIKDSGPGIPESARDKVGQPFFTTKGPGKGTGLGLSISKTIIEKHGGTFEFDFSTPVTTLKITLPKATPKTQSA
jgi:signal transduction histidine kinase